MKKIATKPHFLQDGIGRVLDHMADLDPSKGYLVRIEEDNPVRTSRQNRYYRGVVVESFRKGLAEQGINMPHHIAHEVLLCAYFGINSIDVGGNKFEWPVRRTTTDEYGNHDCLTIGEMVKLTEHSINYAAELGVSIDGKKE